jgi:uncharacterized protein YPO0396
MPGHYTRERAAIAEDLEAAKAKLEATKTEHTRAETRLASAERRLAAAEVEKEEAKADLAAAMSKRAPDSAEVKYAQETVKAATDRVFSMDNNVRSMRKITAELCEMVRECEKKVKALKEAWASACILPPYIEADVSLANDELCRYLFGEELFPQYTGKMRMRLIEHNSRRRKGRHRSLPGLCGSNSKVWAASPVG